jgi:hypothetical protein
MLPEFTLDPSNSPVQGGKTKPKSPEEEKQIQELLSRRLKPEERNRLELLLLQRLKERKSVLEHMLQEMSGHWTYEDHFYRYYHGSFKVYAVQTTTENAVKILRDLLPERKLNMAFERIIGGGTGKEFELEHNQDWDRHTRPMLEAFAHAKFMVEMAVRYANLKKPPQPMPNGYAALLYLFDLR